MSNAAITKQAIARAMKELMAHIPFDRITTEDILQASGVSRKTFYYHFRDKYDLVNWIFGSEIMDSILESTTLENWAEGSLKLCRYVQSNQAFYTNAIHATGQNCFSKYLYTLTEKQITKLCQEACGGRTGGRTIAPDDLKFIIDFYYNAFLGVFIPWINTDMKDSPEIIVQRWHNAVDQSLERFIARVAK
jgi:probable dihydroxyacetone kinase regulator